MKGTIIAIIQPEIVAVPTPRIIPVVSRATVVKEITAI